MYVIYDEQGAILHTITGPDKSYEQTLDQHGVRWIALTASEQDVFDVTAHFVDVETRMLRAKPQLQLACDKAIIRADGVDAAVISGIPAGSDVMITMDTSLQFSGRVDDGEVRISADAPARYVIAVSTPNHIPASMEVIAQ